MRLQDLPPSTPLISAAEKGALQAALHHFLVQGQPKDMIDLRFMYFGSYEIIEGAPWSGRIVYPWPHVAGAEFPPLMSAECLADEMLSLSNSPEARYPKHVNESGARKGWEIRATCVKDIRAVIIYAAWVQ